MTSDRILVWVPAGSLDDLGGLDDRLEICEMPDDPATDPRAGDVEVLVLRPGGAIGKLFAPLKNLKVVQVTAAGVDAVIDQIPPGLTVCSTRGALDVPVAEWVVSAILVALKEFPHFLAEQRQGRWSRRAVGMLSGARVTLLGYGAIAKAVEARLDPFGATLTRVARRPRPGVLSVEALPDLLGETDILVVLVPLTPATRGLVGRDALRRLPDGALVVNAARGAVMDQDALADELDAGRLRAVLDVTVPEPLPPGHRLYSTPGVVITPHVSWWTEDGMKLNYDVIAEQLRRYARGEALMNVVSEGY